MIFKNCTTGGFSNRELGKFVSNGGEIPSSLITKKNRNVQNPSATRQRRKNETTARYHFTSMNAPNLFLLLYFNALMWRKLFNYKKMANLG